jgi:hypothetical protein
MLHGKQDLAGCRVSRYFLSCWNNGMTLPKRNSPHLTLVLSASACRNSAHAQIPVQFIHHHFLFKHHSGHLFLSYQRSSSTSGQNFPHTHTLTLGATNQSHPHRVDSRLENHRTDVLICPGAGAGWLMELCRAREPGGVIH